MSKFQYANKLRIKHQGIKRTGTYIKPSAGNPQKSWVELDPLPHINNGKSATVEVDNHEIQIDRHNDQHS